MVHRQHAQFARDYQFWGRWAHTRQDHRGRLYDVSPEVMLGKAKGRLVEASHLRRIFRLRQLTGIEISPKFHQTATAL